MALTQVQVEIAAGATVDVLNGTVYQFAPWNAAVAMNINASAAGIEATILTGSDLILGPASPVTVQATGTPLTTEGFTLQDVVAAGERLSATCTNTTAGAITVTLALNLTPV
jgi:hypothetical protein